MTAPLTYTHPSNIASGYRASPVDYPKRVYPHPMSGGTPSHNHYTGSEDYPLYHREHCKLPRSNSSCCACVDDLQEIPVQRMDHSYRKAQSDAQHGHRNGHDMVAAYGVYSQSEQETGFEYPPQVMVVSQRDGTTANTLARDTEEEDSCCRASLPLGIVILFILCFLIVSGVLFYFNIVTYAPDSTLQDVCESVHCPHGGICMVGSSGETVCRCPVDCPSVLSPVCGADGRTYSNMCALRLYSCTNKMTILVQHPGECDSKDPCQNKVCPATARCVPSEDGQSASCVCPKLCPKFSSDLALSPVCGTDNRDYSDQCDMHRLACEQERLVSVKYESPCDPCTGVECPAGEVCQLDEDRHAECRCADQCAEEDAPVCASDGLTYINECTMQLAACRYKTSLRIVYHGSCSSGVNPCSTVTCSPGEECLITKYGIAQCECVSQCEPVVRQVCGSDGRTYDSECHLRKLTCLDRSGVTVLYNGPCDAEASCKDMSCQYGGVCVLSGGKGPRCQCPQCPLHYDPVCGSDGHSYTNLCQLRATMCLSKTNIQVVHRGVCNGCETKSCEMFTTCATDEGGVARCVCIEDCPKDETPAPVCGSDGNTYQSLCELKKFVCQNKSAVELDYEGSCDQCLDVGCQHGARCRAGVCVCPTSCPEGLEEPVCASDMETYNNECEMQRRACNTSPPAVLTVLFFGACNMKFKTGSINPTLIVHTVGTSSTMTSSSSRDPCLDIQCDFDATCELGTDGFPRCSCLLDCSIEDVNYICGSDFKLYNSTCAMKMEACQRQKEIRLRPLELCKGMEVKPCNGEGAVVDPDTGQELDCGNGPRRQDCPLDSYCHQTPHFARCCPKEAGVYLKSCQDSWYGCCPDKKTPAQGPDHLGCPSLCGCNKIGSYSEACVGDSEQCQCKPGVGGLKCDRCEPGYWGLPKINSGYQGCLLCGCSAKGSVREDCEQMTGRCVCKPGVQGHKCDQCTDSSLILTDKGCTSEAPTTASSQCHDVICHLGAECEETPDGPQCICRLTCPDDDLKEMVCGDDGKLYASKCQLKQFVCQVQKQIGIQSMEFCAEDTVTVTKLASRKLSLGSSFDDAEEVSYIRGKSTKRLHMSHSRVRKRSKRKEDWISQTTKRHNPPNTDSKCALNPCSNGGTCKISKPTGSPICLCPEGFIGLFCSEKRSIMN